jgi:hypothetical protein
VDQVESATGFLGFVQTLAGADVPDRGRTLEDYVRAPWALVQQHRQETPAWALFARLLSHAVTAAPAVKIARDADLTRSQLLDLLRE